MVTQVENVIISADDTRWFASADIDGFRQFLRDPRQWISDNVGCILASSYLIEIKTDTGLGGPRNAVDFVGTSSVIGASCVTKTITVRIHAQSMVRSMRVRARSLQRRNATLTVSSLWPGVAASIASAIGGPVPIEMTYRPPSGGAFSSGDVYPHFDLGDHPDLLADLIVAIVVEPEGLDDWLNAQSIVQRFVWISMAARPQFNRPAGTADTFHSDQGPISIMIEGDEGTGCDPGFIFVACSSDSGTYTGDPTTEDTDIDIDEMVFKTYCKPAPTGGGGGTGDGGGALVQRETRTLGLNLSQRPNLVEPAKAPEAAPQPVATNGHRSELVRVKTGGCGC